MDKINIDGKLSIQVTRGRKVETNIKPIGIVRYELHRDSKIIVSDKVNNGVTLIARNALLDTYFNSVATRPAWYLGLIDNIAFTSVSSGDSLTSHSGWQEYTAYLDASSGATNRIPWTQGVAASQQVINSAPCIYNFNATGTTAGIFVTDRQVKSDFNVAGILWCTALFSAVLPVQSGDELKVFFSVSD